MSAPRWDSVDLTFADLDDENPDEQMGTKAKYWVRMPDDDRRWLVKLVRVDVRDGTLSGEDWAEWLVQHFAAMLGVPTATVRPATFNGAPASVSRNMVSTASERLEHGNSLLSGAHSFYRQTVKGENADYTPSNVRQALHDIRPPRGIPELEHLSAYDVWAGYLVLDAWLAGRDRHDENWAAIQDGTSRWLAPSFDHGNALGFQLRDDKRHGMLDRPVGVETWAAKGKSRHFAGCPTLVELAHDALRLASPDAIEHWRQQLEGIDLSPVACVTSQVPGGRMSEVARNFTVRLLEINRRRLLDGYPSI